MPLTRITVEPPGPTRRGTLIVARTGVGRLGFDDPMEVVHWAPPTDHAPGRCRLEKRGRVVAGWAQIEVRPRDGRRSDVIWYEDVRISRAGRLLDAPAAWCGRLLFGRLVSRLLGE